ncbi:protein translocase subunit SecF [Tissierella sp. MB52-C2]|uniref:protein translocase subunit SecF n=1 Tax=Tissierella sp. MB52-C2 TaxID=3070999 RepID=UPI00280B3C2A|nr:protein translocase subunit SecF [Tissierella sp. MB52-C2]WMM26832.1 protein translocase subunit SecF [Tissierella sp. MB52-C2]
MNIIKNRKIFAICSLAIIVIGLLMFFIKGFNYGIDFTGGTLIEINAGKYIPVDEVREITDEYDKNASILHGGENKSELIIKSTLDLSNNTVTEIVNKFAEKYNIDRSSFQSEKFGPFMGKEIRNKALLSILIATILMLIYISWRFEFNFGLAAIIALVHDVLIMVAVYSIFRIPVNSSFIAAILTILGYSINDTIVIFDRIREESKLYPKESVGNLVNNSIKKSLTRTINTSITTLIAVVVIYILGVEDIKVLALPLMIGIITGTYSSLFIASPIWYELKNRKIKTAK